MLLDGDAVGDVEREKEDAGELASVGAVAVVDYAVNPVRFIHDVLGDAGTPYAKQREMLEAVTRHRRVSVVGCNGSGKDWTVARIILWWIETRARAKVVVTGPTQRQVQDVVWREMRTAYAKARTRLVGKMFTARYEVDEERFALGFSTNQPDNLQGFHSPNLLAVVTEAHGVGQEYIDALKRLNPKLLLLTGNALRLEGEFYDSHHTKSDLYHRIVISAFDTPNLIAGNDDAVPGMLTAEDVEERRRDWGEDHPLYLAAVLAQFPPSLADSLLSRTLLDAAVARWKANAPEGGEPWVMGVDVARFGRDKTVLILRRGSRVEEIVELSGEDTMLIANRVVEGIERHAIKAVYVDGIGIGAGVVDRLQQLGQPVIDVQVGGSASNIERYVNLRAEIFWELRERFVAGEMSIPDDTGLAAQLLGLRYDINSSGKLLMESKGAGRSRGVKSPDKADALALAFMDARASLGLWV